MSAGDPEQEVDHPRPSISCSRAGSRGRGRRSRRRGSRVAAHEAGLGAHDDVEPAHQPDRAGDESDDVALEHRVGEVPERDHGRYTSASWSSSKYHLLTRNACALPRAGDQARGGARVGDVEVVRDTDPDDRDHAADAEPDPRRRGRLVDRLERRVLERRVEELGHEVVDAGDLDVSADYGQHGEHRHRRRHRPRPLGDPVVAGKPTSVSSFSPVAGLTGSARYTSPPSSERASGHGSPKKTEDDPEGVDPGQQRADVAADDDDPERAAALRREAENLILGEEARGARKAASARAPTVIRTKVSGIARRNPMRSMSWIPAIAEITDPAPMNRSALKNAWLMREHPSPHRRRSRPRPPCSRSG